MRVKVESWHLNQLLRMHHTDPERVENLLNYLFEVEPELLQDLAISAVDQEELSVNDAAQLLGFTPEAVEEVLLNYRRRKVPVSALVYDDERHVARLASSRIAVWEIIRTYRKVGSIQSLCESYPGLSENELIAALTYASEHPEEIETSITEYEAVHRKRQEEYPYTLQSPG